MTKATLQFLDYLERPIPSQSKALRLWAKWAGLSGHEDVLAGATTLPAWIELPSTAGVNPARTQ
jgi:hypothetical protein